MKATMPPSAATAADADNKISPFQWRLVALVISGLAIWICTTTAYAKPPEWTQAFPTGVQQGNEVEIALTGSFDHWPPSVTPNDAGLEIKPSDDAKKKSLIVKAAKDARPGIHWVRLYDEEGATALRPLIVSSCEEVTEKEPNNQLSDAQTIDLPVAISGKLEKSGEVDGFRTSVKANQDLVASLRGHRWLGSPMDAVLQICDSNGFVLAQNDDSRGFDPLVVWRAPKDMDVVVRIFAFPATPNSTIGFSGGATYIYRLAITAGPFVDHSLPLTMDDRVKEPSSVLLFGWNLPAGAATDADTQPFYHHTFTQADASGFAIAERLDLPSLVASASTGGQDDASDTVTEIDPPVAISGRLVAAGERHRFRIQGKKGSRLRIQADSLALGFLLDPIVTVLDANEKVVAEADDRGRNDQDASLDLVIPADGPHEIHVRDTHGRGGDRMVYRLTIAAPAFELTVDTHQFIVEPGKPLELKVAVAREKGFTGEIKIEAIGLPEGVTAEAVTSASKGDSAKSVTLKLVSAGKALVQGSFQIVGASGDVRRSATHAIANSPQRMKDLWVTAKKK